MLAQFFLVLGMYGAACSQIADFKLVNKKLFVLVSVVIAVATLHPDGGFLGAGMLVVLLLFLNFKNLKVHINLFGFLSQLSIAAFVGYVWFGLSLYFYVLIGLILAVVSMLLFRSNDGTGVRLIYYLAYSASIVVTFIYLAKAGEIQVFLAATDPLSYAMTAFAGWVLFFYIFHVGIIFLAFSGGKAGFGITVLYDALPQYIEFGTATNLFVVTSVVFLSLFVLVVLYSYGTSILIAAGLISVISSYVDEKIRHI